MTKTPGANPLTYSIPELEREANVGKTTLYQEINAGRLKAKKIGRRTIITADAAANWLAQLPDYD